MIWFKTTRQFCPIILTLDFLLHERFKPTLIFQTVEQNQNTILLPLTDGLCIYRNQTGFAYS